MEHKAKGGWVKAAGKENAAFVRRQIAKYAATGLTLSGRGQLRLF